MNDSETVNDNNCTFSTKQITANRLVDSVIQTTETKGLVLPTYKNLPTLSQSIENLNNNVSPDQKDENGNPIIIHNVSIDAPTPDCLDMLERISLNYNLEDEIICNNSESVSDKTREYLNNLTKDQREVAYLIMDGYSCEEIKEILHIEQNEFTNCMNGLKAYRNISILF